MEWSPFTWVRRKSVVSFVFDTVDGESYRFTVVSQSVLVGIGKSQSTTVLLQGLLLEIVRSWCQGVCADWGLYKSFRKICERRACLLYFCFYCRITSSLNWAVKIKMMWIHGKPHFYVLEFIPKRQQIRPMGMR
jgi:hypothetical protein